MVDVKIKKPKARGLLATIGAGGFVQYATDDEHERAKKLTGRVVEIHPKSKNRNLKFHRKYFALIRLGYQYWKPKVSLLSEPELNLAHDVAKKFCELGGNPELYELQGREIADLVLSELSNRRKRAIEVDSYKNEEMYRKEVMIEAGFCETVYMPHGGTVKVPWSIAFDNLSEDDFRTIYKGCLDVIWNKTLYQVFDDQNQVEIAVAQLMRFI